MKKAILGALVLVMSVAKVSAQVPDPGFTIDEKTAIVITDPQNDFLSPNGATWAVVGKSVTENKTVENLEKLFKVAQHKNVKVFVSPHYYFPHDHNWEYGGAGETLMHAIKMFDRKGQLTTEGFEGSGADWLDLYKPYINKENVIVSSPHKIFGPESNDLALQLRKHGYNKIVLAGMSANLCVDSHMRELVENGFEVAIVTDATAGTILPDMDIDGYKAAMANFRLISSHLFKTDEVVKAFSKLPNAKK
ncbi:MAG: cysteine hydrolase [Cruoricaptor ignavus]|nr:cysteine hydrolase [Cruoricaptor ignavus]